jgi:hypothetical protein
LETPAQSIIDSVKSAPQYQKVIDLVAENPEYIVYCENMQPGRGPCKIEMPREKHSLILIDMYDTKKHRFASYNLLHQHGYHHKVPVVKLIDVITPMTIEELKEQLTGLMVWCKTHHKEGIVGKTYYGNEQIIFKEKIDLPKCRAKKNTGDKPVLPVLPDDMIKSAVLQGIAECGMNGEDIKQPKFAMPRVARHVSVQAKEHHYSSPKNIFGWYRRYLQGKF